MRYIVGILEGVCDVVRHEESGLLLKTEVSAGEEQVEAYRNCLTRLVNNRRERARLSQFALMEASCRTWPEAMEALVNGYRKVVEQKMQRLITA